MPAVCNWEFYQMQSRKSLDSWLPFYSKWFKFNDVGHIHAVVRLSEFSLNLLTCLSIYLCKRRPISTIRMIGLIVYTYTLPNRLDVSTETCTSLLCFDAISLSICMQRPRKCLQCLGVGNNVRSAHSAISSFFKPQCILSGRCHFFNVQASKWSILWMMIHHELFCILYAMASVRLSGLSAMWVVYKED